VTAKSNDDVCYCFFFVLFRTSIATLLALIPNEIYAREYLIGKIFVG